LFEAEKKSKASGLLTPIAHNGGQASAKDATYSKPLLCLKASFLQAARFIGLSDRKHYTVGPAAKEMVREHVVFDYLQTNARIFIDPGFSGTGMGGLDDIGSMPDSICYHGGRSICKSWGDWAKG